MVGAKLKILIVDDEAIFVLYLKKRLVKLGFEVTAVANNYHGAIKAVEKNIPDLTLMDINIKGSKNGIETAKDIKKLFNVRSLFISAYNDNETLEKILKEDPVGILNKPLEEEKLQELLLNFKNVLALDLNK